MEDIRTKNTQGLKPPLKGFVQDSQPRVNSKEAENVAMATALELPEIDIDAETKRILNGGQPVNPVGEANTQNLAVPGKSNELVNQIVKDTLFNSSSPSRNRFMMDTFGEDVDTEALPFLHRFATNLATADKLIFDAIQQTNPDRSTFEAIVDGVDYFLLRGITLGFLEDSTRVSDRVGNRQFQELLTLDEASFKESLAARLEDFKSEGFFSRSSLFGLQNRVNQLNYKGLDPNTTSDQILAIGGLALDVALLGGGKGLVGAAKAIKMKHLSSPNPVALAASEGKTAHKAAQAASGSPTNARANVAAGPTTLNPNPTSAANTAPLRAISQQNKVVQNLGERLIRSFTPDELAAQVAVKSANISQKINNPVLFENFAEVELDRFVADIIVGSSKGAPFKTPTAANNVVKKLKEQLPTSEVAVEKFQGGFGVRVSQDIKVNEVVGPAELQPDPSNAFFAAIGRTLGSTRYNEGGDAMLSGLADGNEAVLAGLTADVSKDFISTFRKINKQEEVTLKKVVEGLWNGPDAGRRLWYTDAEFAVVYQQLGTGAAPSQKVIDAYRSLQSTSDAAAFFSAQRRVRSFVENGYVKVGSSNYGNVLGRNVDPNSITDDILDLQAPRGGNVFINDKSRVKTLYRLDAPIEVNGKKVKYAANPDEVKLIGPDDVMGFNAGPHRANPNARYFVTFDNDAPKALLATFSRKQLNVATKELGELTSKIKNKTITDADVLANNKFNPNITTVKELADWLKSKGWDEGQELSFKQRDGRINDEVLSDSYDDWGGYFDAKPRGDTVLDEFGGEPTYNVNPAKAIADQLGSTTHAFAFNGYTVRSKNILRELAKENPEAVAQGKTFIDDVHRFAEEATFVGNSPAAEKMRNLQSAIKARLRTKTGFDRFMENMGNSFKEFIFDTTKIKLGTSDAAQNTLLNINFQSAMGFFNVSQFFMQGFQMVSIGAIAPRHAPVAVGMAPFLNQLAMFPTGPVSSRIAKGLAKVSGHKEDTFHAAAEYLRTSGRDIVDATSLEKGTASAFNFSNFGDESVLKTVLGKTGAGVQAGLNAGLYPFRKGEQASRRTAIMVAHMEYATANPGKSLRHPDAISWIQSREQALTFNMNTASKGTIQQGWMRVPTQWMSYTMRTFEVLATGRFFTPAERARLGMILGPMMGLGYFGMEGVAEHLTESFGGEPGGDVYKFLQYGVMDGMSSLLGSDISFSSRVSYPAALLEMYDKFTGNLPEAIAGPSGSIAYGFVDKFYAGMSHLINGRPTLFTQESLELVRNVKGIDNIVLAHGVMEHGLARTRNGVVYPFEMDVADAAIFAAGFKPVQYQELLLRKDYDYASAKKFKDRKTYYDRRFDLAISLVSRDDDEAIERGNKMLVEIAAEMNLDASISEKQKWTIRKNLMNEKQNEIAKLTRNLIERNRINEAQSLANLINQEGEE